MFDLKKSMLVGQSTSKLYLMITRRKIDLEKNIFVLNFSQAHAINKVKVQVKFRTKTEIDIQYIHSVHVWKLKIQHYKN